MSHRLFFCVCIILLLSPGLFATDFVIEEILQLEPSKFVYQLGHQNIVSYSETVKGDEKVYLRTLDYSVDYYAGTISLQKSVSENQLRVSYLVIPPELSKTHSSYKRLAIADSLIALPHRPPQQWLSNSSNLNINGSKTFSLSFSESGETDLLQSLYVNLSGELARDVSISAQLSDSQSKLSPEGDSKELSSLDQVFVRISGKKWELGMGDLELSYENSRYLNYFSKLEGVSASYKGNSEIAAAYSAASGKSASISVEILDGKQGPYYLTPNSTQRSFIIIAGTEQIYVDGSLWERGTDYYIDYSEGSLMFRRLIGSLNTVNAIFQYSDENYKQSTYYSRSRIPLGEYFELKHHLVHQSDSRDHPLLFSFSPEDLDSLALSGDNPAYSPGIMITEPGSGNYILLTDADGNPYYEYAPADSAAMYNLFFSYVGPGKGDYEQFSIGTYRYVGIGEGAWQPLKTLLAPASRSNMELSLAFNGQGLHSGIDAMYSLQDENTLSKLDDDDNSAGIVSAWLEYKQEGSPISARLDAVHRFANTYRFGSDGAPEHDLAALPKADSLAMTNLDFLLNYHSSTIRPEILIRYREIENLYKQKAIRFSMTNPASGFVPSVAMRNTISRQEGKLSSFLMYHDATLAWQYRLMRIFVGGLYSSLEEEDNAIKGNRLISLKPGIEFRAQNSLTTIQFAEDVTSLKEDTWRTLNTQQTYTFKHNSTFSKHSIDLDFSNRIQKVPHSDTQAKSNYHLFNYRSSHNVLKGGLSMFANYQLNQTEFYPRIRELVWVGSSEGIYDSTGVVIDDGEYIYEYITSAEGSLSTEISGTASLYLKPGMFLDRDFFNRLHADVSLSANEQTDQTSSWQSFLFLPDYSFGSSSIFARRNLLNNIWLDIYKDRIICNLSFEHMRSLDQRYQVQEKSSESIQRFFTDFKGFASLNTRIGLSRESQSESRYFSSTELWKASVFSEKILNAQSTLQAEMGFSSEAGKQQQGDNDYRLQSVYFSPALRSVLMQKYRINIRGSLAFNSRNGSDYLLFLPQKRAGVLGDLSLSGIYRINNFSSISAEYRFAFYPQEKSRHNLKLEFKAEL